MILSCADRAIMRPDRIRQKKIQQEDSFYALQTFFG